MLAIHREQPADQHPHERRCNQDYEERCIHVAEYVADARVVAIVDHEGDQCHQQQHAQHDRDRVPSRVVYGR